MTRQVTIAAVQIPAAPTGTTNAEIQESNFTVAEHWLNQAGGQGADIACIGETFNILGMTLRPDTLRSELDGVLDQTLTRFSAIARRHHMVIVAPIAALVEGTPRNVALIVDRQ